jgi:16S rRNA (cytidine1402-2'-O)-methyltransferase
VTAGQLIVVGTPIGNLGDLSPRAREALACADVVACEDTRHTGLLLKRSGVIAKRLLSLHEHNEAARVPEILSLLDEGRSVAVVSDAGMPCVSDPGARVVAAAAGAGHTVSVVPGPSAVVAAAAVSGIVDGRFCFEGFLPRRGAERRARLAAIAGASAPSVVYEAPRRVSTTLAELAAVCGEQRSVAICRELTKLHEETWRGSLGQAAARPGADEPRGEYVLVVAGRPEAAPASAEQIESALRDRIANGADRRSAVAEVTSALGASRRDVYEAALRLKSGPLG